MTKIPIKKIDTRELNKLLSDGSSGYFIYKNRKILLCRTLQRIQDMNKHKMKLWYDRREKRDKLGLCHMCGKNKIALKSKSRCVSCLEKARKHKIA